MTLVLLGKVMASVAQWVSLFQLPNWSLSPMDLKKRRQILFLNLIKIYMAQVSLKPLSLVSVPGDSMHILLWISLPNRSSSNPEALFLGFLPWMEARFLSKTDAGFFLVSKASINHRGERHSIILLSDSNSCDEHSHYLKAIPGIQIISQTKKSHPRSLATLLIHAFRYFYKI